MHPLLLSESFEGLTGLAPFFIVPIAIIVGAPSILAIRFLNKNSISGRGLLLFLLGVLNLGMGLTFVSITYDVYTGANVGYKERYWALVGFAYLCSGAMVAAGSFAVYKVLYRLYKRTSEALKDRMGDL